MLPQGNLANRQSQGRVTRLERASFAGLAGLQPGETIDLPLSDRESIPGTVQFVHFPADGAVSVIGGLVGRQGGFTLESENGRLRGQMLLMKEETAYRIEDVGGEAVQWKEVPLGQVVCVPPEREPMTARMEQQTAPLTGVGGAPEVQDAPPPVSEPAPLLDSRPSALVQFYLNFNGETVSGTIYNTLDNGGNPIVAAPAGLTAAQITTIFNEVAEYFRSFDVNVTTDLARYTAAPATRRMKCVITPTNIAGGGAAGTLGYAALDTYGTTSPNALAWAYTHDVPTYGIDAVAISVAHEIGHTLSLEHDGINTAEYLTGHGQGSVKMSTPNYTPPVYNHRWGPIMGSPVRNGSFNSGGQTFYVRVKADLVQWSKGEYQNASELEDDLTVIAGKVGSVADEDGGTPDTAAQLSVNGTTINQSGVIMNGTPVDQFGVPMWQADADYFRFSTTGGTATITVTATRPSLDASLQILGADGGVIASDSPSPSVNASITRTLGAGQYYVKVAGVGDGDWLTNGYSSYGSIGSYTITGTVPGFLIPPTVSNAIATNVGTNSATLGGTVSESLAGTVTGRGVVLSITSSNADPVIGGSYVQQISTSGATGSFTVQASSLINPVQYSFRAYATYEGGVAYSPVATFSTLGNAPPTVITPTAANIAATTATLGGNVTSAGTQPVTERGVCYALTSVNASPQPNNGNVTNVTTSGTTGVFTVNATGLLANSQYSYRAYALSAEGWGWSTVGTFTTPVTAPTLTTTVTLNEHARGATLVGRVNPNGMTVTPLFFYGKSPDQMSYQQATPSSVSGSSPVEVRYDLSGDVHTTYYYAVGYMIQGFPPVMASDVKTFTTVDTTPVAFNSEASLPEDTSSHVLLSAKDEDGDMLTMTLITQPAHGTLSAGYYLPGYGQYMTYTPEPNFHGTDSFVFYATDPQGKGGFGYAQGTVNITVTPRNDPPTLNEIPNPALLEDAGPQTVSLSGISTGAPNETQTLTVTATSSNTALIPHPTVNYTSPNATGTLTFTPVANARGLAVITVTVNDGETTTDRTFLVTVNQVNKEPTFALPSSGLPAGETWTAQASGNRNWWAVTSSADGTKLAAVVYGGSIYTSTDAGVTWVERPGTYGLWSAITSSADGRKLAAALNNGYVHISTDAGLTWTAQSSSGQRKWTGIVSSADGTKLAAVANGNFSENAEYIYTSTDSGVTWTRQENAYGQWTGIASSSDGTKLAAARGSVYTSTNSGATWTSRSADGRSIASSADGTKLIAAGADVYTSANSGANWTWRLDGNRNWRSVTSSADGTRLAAVTNINGQIYTSADSGLTWTTQSAGSRDWMSIASSADGSRLAAVVLNGQIYTSSAPLYNMTVSSGAGTMSIPSFATAISVGPPEETGQTVSFQVTNDNNALFSVQPAIAPNGTLTFTPNPTATPAKVTVSVTARDDGGTANGGVDTSFTHRFTITLAMGSVTHTYANATDEPLTSSAPVIAGGSTASLALDYAPVAGTELVVINNTGPGFISGAFTNLAHGQTVSLSYAGEDYDFVANYYGGTGNDLVLTWKNTRLMAWGRNDYGQLGNNSTTQSLVPAATLTSGVLSGKTIITVSAGYLHSLALCSDGTVAAWGNNSYGQLGNNSTTQSAVPVAVDVNGVLSGKTVVAIAAGAYHSVALCSDGTVVAWGDNQGGALGNNTAIASGVPVAVDVSGVLSGKTVTAISAGYYHSLVLCSDGTVAAWGDNRNGQLGNNSTTNSHVPVAVNTSGVLFGKTVVAVSGSYFHNVALCSDGTVAAWGDNEYGQLGNNNTTRSLVPVAVNNSGVLSGKLVVAVEAGDVHSVALCSDGTLAVWGNNGNGQLGNNSTTNSSVPVAVDTGGVLAGKTVVAFTVGGHHTVVRCSDGTVVAWGFNYYGQLGNNSTTQSLVPATVDARNLVGCSALRGGSYHSLALAAVPTVNAPTVTVGAASGLAGMIATLNGTVNANGGSTTVTFHYGTTTSYGQTAVAQPATVTGAAPVPVSAALSGLQPRTLYHFRLSATNAAGTINSADASFTTPNSTPLAFGRGGLNTAEDIPMDILLDGLDADGDALTFAVATQPAHGTVSITGSTATYTPAAEFHGDDSFTFTARDGFGGVSEPALVNLVITPVNDLPTLAALSPLPVNEDAGWQTVEITGIGTGATDELDFLRVIASSSNPSLVDTMYVQYLSPASTGLLTLVLRPDAHGTATITVSVSDEVDTTSRTFDLVVNPVNDAPSFAMPSGGSFTAFANAGFTAVPGFVTSISPGPANEAGQSVDFTVTNTNNELFSVQPAITSDGTLTFMPDPSRSGTATVTVTAQDDGGTANGGTATSAPQSFTFNVLSSNADLAGLALSQGMLSPAFSPVSVTDYTATVSHNTASLTVTPTAANAASTVRVNGGVVPSGSASPALPLQVGLNPITILVTAENGTSKAYTVTVTRLAPPTLGTPLAFAVSATGAESECPVTSDGGAPVTQRGMVYAITSTNDTPRLGGTGVMQSPDGGFDTTQVSAFLLGLTPGTSYSFAAYATNSEGTSYSSTGTFTTPSDNADLSGLVLSAGALSPSFASGTTAYTASVSNVTDTITVTPTAAQADATIRVNNVIVPTGSPSLPIPLVVGANVINIAVTAEDGSTLKAYTVTVTRRAPPTLGEPVASDFLSLGLGPAVRCAVTSDGGAPVTQRGVVYAVTSINGTPRIDGTGVTNTVMTGGDVNQIDYVFFGLTPGTSYSFVAYATNSEGTSYSSTTTFTILTPEIVMTGNGINIADGDTSPTLGDHTDFGSTATAGGTVTRTFAIQNTGDATLTLGPVVIGGADAASFIVNAPPPSSVPTGQSTTFQVTFDPGTAGLHFATLSFTTNDADENPFNFSIQGAAYSSTTEAEAATWAESHGLSGADAAPTAEPFADGVPNLLKYAFNMPLTGPNVSGLAPGTGTSGLPAVTVPGTSGPPDAIRVEFIRRRNSGLIYTPLYSVNGLGNFIPMTAPETVTTIDANWERVVVNQPLGLPLPTTTFSRVSVTAP
ncbi:tandem-95 repeat protein [Prosthecobacter sp.]|uniref:RCC1 domain-containing protein n=1 Tax=Prosthecobacter sp. TaxID=1965333 RepID=UPI0025E76192|nr:tandem-95 repeat protein [Prosthecobacter sp.]